MNTVLISAPYILPQIDRFLPLFERHHLEIILAPVKERLSEDELMNFTGSYDGTVCGDDIYTAKVLNANASRLKVISKWGTGIDSIDQETARSLGIQVRNTPDAFSIPVADTVLGYMLAFARRQPWMDRTMKGGKWEKIPGRALHECTLGVVGVGNCGKAVIRRARAFGMTIFGNDIVEIDKEFLASYQVEMMDLDNVLSHSDFVSLNCDLNPTSFHLINERSLEWMQPTSVLINASRGPVVDEPALIKALQSRKIAGAALDVYEIEPLPQDSLLLGMDNVLLAPHNANSSPTAWEHVHQNTIRNLFDGLGIKPDL
jgi:D-3-phosphoglycerate dehydrogenase